MNKGKVFSNKVDDILFFSVPILVYIIRNNGYVFRFLYILIFFGDRLR